MTEDEALIYYTKSIDKIFEEASPAEYVAAIILEPLQGKADLSLLR